MTALHCQRCPEGTVMAEYKIREADTKTGEIIRWWYLCSEHVETDYAPWLTKKVRAEARLH